MSPVVAVVDEAAEPGRRRRARRCRRPGRPRRSTSPLGSTGASSAPVTGDRGRPVRSASTVAQPKPGHVVDPQPAPAALGGVTMASTAGASGSSRRPRVTHARWPAPRSADPCRRCCRTSRTSSTPSSTISISTSRSSCMPSIAACDQRCTVSGAGDAAGAGPAVADRQHLGAGHGLGAGQRQLDQTRPRARRRVHDHRPGRASEAAERRRRPAR